MQKTRKTAADIKAMKGRKEAFVCLTAYTMRVAQILDKHCDLLLVGDTMGMVLYGMENTRGVTLDMIINHGRAVRRGAKQACVIVDMPYGTYEDSPAQALENARRVMEETGCDGVKIEGGEAFAATVATLVKNNIPVIGHIGLLPQSVEDAKGFKVQGKTDEGVAQLLKDAKKIEKAGASAIVIEATIESVAEEITKAIQIPSIGIGASASCDGQILVTEDMMGITGDHVPKFVKQYAHVSEIMDEAAARYASEVRSRKFPAEEQTYIKKAG